MKSLAIITFLSLIMVGAGCTEKLNAERQTSNAGAQQTEIQKPVDETADGALILYWAEGCSHCETVKQKISGGRLDEKLNIIQKESYNDDVVYQEFFSRAEYCQIPIHQMGVPMLWDGEKCYRGVQQIMGALASKAN